MPVLPDPPGTPRRRPRAWSLPLAIACLALAGCERAPPPPSNVTPEKAIATNLRLTAAGDFDGLMKNRLPPADYTQWRAEWDHQHAHPMPPTVAQEKQFADVMRMLTEPDAETRLATRLQPELAAPAGGKDRSLPILSGILEAAVRQMIADSPQLGPGQRALADQGVDALAAWAKTADLRDAKKATKAIALACTTARALHVETLAQWRALDYAATMRNYAIVWNGLESLLHLYGVDFAGSLLHAKIETLADAGNHATVRLHLQLAGRALSGEWPMQKQAGHWYDASLIDAWRKAHPAAAGTLAPVPAATLAPTPAASVSPPPASAATAAGAVHR